MTTYYRWPSGIFEELGLRYGWSVMKYRPSPCTPAGEELFKSTSKKLVDDMVRRLNEGFLTEDDVAAMKEILT